jgi:hypothetical protein
LKGVARRKAPQSPKVLRTLVTQQIHSRGRFMYG